MLKIDGQVEQGQVRVHHVNGRDVSSGKTEERVKKDCL
jgi:hypothetical protein